MIRIAICDDEQMIAEEIRLLLEELSRKYIAKFEITDFYSGESLLRSIGNDCKFDLIYMDIEMRIMNGISTAKIIREKSYKVLIVYVSAHESYLRELFDVEPFRFINKPIDVKIFNEVFEAAYKRICIEDKYFIFCANKSMMKIPISAIIYFDSVGRIVNIHMKDKDYAYYDKLDLVEKQVINDKYPFIRVHKSFLVNYLYIKKVEHKKVILSNDKIINISEDRRKQVREICMNLIAGKDK